MMISLVGLLIGELRAGSTGATRPVTADLREVQRTGAPLRCG